MKKPYQQKQKLKLLHVLFSIDTGGLEKMVLELCRRIDNNCIEQSVCCLTDEGDLTPEFASADIKLHYMHKKEGLSFLLSLRIAQLCRREKIDIVHTHDGTANLYGALGARLAGVKKVFNTEHGRIYYDTQRKKTFNRFLAMCNTLMVCVSQSVKSELLNMGIPDQKLAVISNGIDIEKYKSAVDRRQKRASLDLNLNDFVVCSVGRLSEEKNPFLLLEAAKKVINQVPKIKIIIVGDGPLRLTLEKRIKEEGLQNVVFFLGTRNDIAEILSISDCFVSTSNFESFGLAILEAMMCEVPVIATNVGGVGELVQDQVTGGLIDKGNSQALAENIVRVYKDPLIFKKITIQAKEFAIKNFDITAMCTNYHNLYLGRFYKNSQIAHNDLRVLHLISSSGLFGAENVLLNLARKTNGNKSIAYVGAFLNSQNPHLELIEEAKKYNLPTYILNSHGRFDLFSVFRLLNFLKKEKIDILHTHNYKSNLIGFFSARLAGIPIISTVHGYTNGSISLSLYENFDKFILKRLFDKVIVVNDAMFNNFDKRKSVVINNAVDTDKFSHKPDRNFRKDLGITQDEMIVGTVGRLSIEKNQELLIKTINELKKKYSNLKCIIVGDGPLKERLQYLVSNLKLEDKIIFTGNQSDVVSLYKTFDIFVLPSLTEGMPIVILEAFASGVAVISSNVGGIHDIVLHDKTGLLFDSGDVKGLARNLSLLIESKEKRMSLAENAKKFVHKNYSLEKMVSSYMEVYSHVLLN